MNRKYLGFDRKMTGSQSQAENLRYATLSSFKYFGAGNVGSGANRAEGRTKIRRIVLV